jgi:hypothetical protein
MESAIIDQVAADIWADHGRCALRATGSSILFDGFLTRYQEGRDDIPASGPDDEAAGMLPRLNAGDDLARKDVRPDQHFTQPPPRYSEASLIKKLEELGITLIAVPSVGADQRTVNLLLTPTISRLEGFVSYQDESVSQPVEAEVDVLLGGKTDPRLGGGPLALRGRLRWCGDGLYTGDGPMIGGQQRSWGPTAVLQVQGIAILVVTHAAQMWDQQQFKAFGIDPQAYRVVALKSAQHFRAAFEPIAGEVIVCDSGALAGPDCTTRRYERAPRPVFPLEQDIDLAQWRTKLQH